MDDTPAVNFFAKFIEKYGDEHCHFNICNLYEAISMSCLAEDRRQRKTLALYFDNENESFSQTFCRFLTSRRIKVLLDRHFLFLGWDVSDSSTHDIMIQMLEGYSELSVLIAMVQKKKSGLFLITAVRDMIKIFSFVQILNQETELIDQLNTAHEEFLRELDTEANMRNSNQSDNVYIDPTCFQQMMFDMLGNRDYDAFEEHQSTYLKEKIGFAFFGPPQRETGYDDKQKKKIDEAFETICSTAETFAEIRGRVIISFIYNCLVPMPQEQEKRRRENPEYNPDTDYLPLPVFVLKKCTNRQSYLNACRVFIDHDLRVYDTWVDYINNNNLHECIMVLPKNGRYEGSRTGAIMLERHLSPACGAAKQILNGLDITSTVLGFASGGVFAATLIPAITVAPFALAAAGVVGAGVGVYSIVRGSVHLYDRFAHGQNISLFHPEARGTYINILGGTLGFAGAGATTAVASLASEGVQIGQATRMAVNAVNIASISMNGIGIAHSTYEIIDQYINDKVTPSALTVVQLASSVLFFGNAVYNFRTATAVIDETQTRVLSEYQKSLRSNRHRKTFKKMRLETIRQNGGDATAGNAEVISVIRKVPNKDEVFAALTRSNRDFNREKVKFAANNGQVTLNGIPIDIMDFSQMTRTQRLDFIADLPSGVVTAPTVQDVSYMENIIRIAFTNDQTISAGGHLPVQMFSRLLNAFCTDIRQKILTALHNLWQYLNSQVNMNITETLRRIFPNQHEMVIMLEFVLKFYKDEARRLWGEVENIIMRMEELIRNSFSEATMNLQTVREMARSFMSWLAGELVTFEQVHETHRTARNRGTRITCTICNGTYFTPM